MTYADFKKQMPTIKSPFVEDKEGVIYKPAYDKYSDRFVYFKGGRRGSDKISTETAYKGDLDHTFDLSFGQDARRAEGVAYGKKGSCVCKRRLN